MWSKLAQAAGPRGDLSTETPGDFPRNLTSGAGKRGGGGRMPLRESGQSGIVVWGDRLLPLGLKPYDPEVQPEGKTATVIGLWIDTTSGDTIWEYKIQGINPGVYRSGVSGPSPPMPNTDGAQGWFFNAAGQLVYLDWQGQWVWTQERRLARRCEFRDGKSRADQLDRSFPGPLAVAAGANLYHEIEGLDLKPVLEGRSLERQSLFWHYPHCSNQGGIPAGAIRQGDLKLIQRDGHGRGHLYNLKEDVGDQHDLAVLAPEVVIQMRTRLHKWDKEVAAKFLQLQHKEGGPEPGRP